MFWLVMFSSQARLWNFVSSVLIHGAKHTTRFNIGRWATFVNVYQRRSSLLKIEVGGRKQEVGGRTDYVIVVKIPQKIYRE